jgi:hypothetical protein
MIRKERRRAPRTSSSVPIDLYDSDGQMIIGEGRFVNISLAGTMLESRQSLHLRQPVRLQVQSPAKSPMEFTGRVIWRKKKSARFLYGIHFEPLAKTHVFAHQTGEAVYSHLSR